MSDGDDSDVQAVEALVRRVWDRFAAQDPQGMLACMHEEATIWDIFQPQLVTRRSLEAYVASDYQQSAARGPLTMTLRDFVTTIWGGCAIVRFYLDYRYEPPNAAQGNGRITCVLRHCGERGWLLVHVHEGHIPGGIPPLQRAT